MTKEKSRALPFRYYSRSPEDNLIAKEAETCAGCAHEAEALGKLYCEKKRVHGRRCKLYTEGSNG